MNPNFNRRDLLVTASAAATAAIPTAAFAQNAPAATVANTPSDTSGVPDNEKPVSIVTLRDLEAQAEKIMAPFGFAYVAGGAGDEWTKRENMEAFNRWVINPDFMSGVGSADTTTTILGTTISYPVITAPTGNQGSVHAQADAPNVKGSGAAGTIFCASSVSQLSLEEIAAATDAPKWFQLYIPRDRGYGRELLQRARAAGYKAIIVTADLDVTSNRERSTRLQGAAMPNLRMGNMSKVPGSNANPWDMKGDMAWSDIEFCRQESGLPVIVKSILSPRQALQGLEHGCSAIWLSNHGGRQLDNTAAPMTMLPRVVQVVDGAAPIIIDGGIFRGQDVFRALALGASAVAIGRPTLYGSALGGAQGVQAVHAHLRDELTMVMRLAGTPTIRSITRDFISRSEAFAV